MDITIILPRTNKAGCDLVSILEKDNQQKLFKKIVSLITSYININRKLLTQQVIIQYVYDIIYKDYVTKIKERYASKYASYVLNILHTKYVDFLTELNQLAQLYENI